MKRLTFTLILVCLASVGFGQSAIIKGQITEVDSVIFIPGAAVILEGTEYAATSNSRGEFIIEDVPYGAYTLITKTYGYKSVTRTVKVDKPEINLNIVLNELVADLPGVTIVGGGRSGVREISGAVHYISAKELERFSYTDINRVLRNVPGVNIQEEDGFGLRPNIGMRGTGVERSSNITIMEDGILSAPAPYSAPAAYYFPTVGRMQGIEIMKGSSQIQHGPYTTGGAINFISTQIPDEFGGRLTLMGGRYKGRNLHANVGNRHKNVAYMVETFQYGSDGFKNLDGGGNTGFTKEDYLAKVRVNTNPDANIYQSLTFKAGMVRETSNETYLGLTEDDFNADPYRRYRGSEMDQMNTEQSQFTLTHSIRFTDNLSLTTTGYRNEFSRNWYKLDKVRDSAGNNQSIGNVLDNSSSTSNAYNIVTGSNSSYGALTVKANNRSYLSQGVQTRLNYDFETGKLKHNIVAGVRVHQDQIDRFQWVDGYTMDEGVMKLASKGEPGTESNRVETANAVAAYLQYQFKFNRFSITPGLRYENVRLERMDFGKSDPNREGTDLSERENQVEAFIPGIGVRFDWTENLQLFTGVHKGFAPPGSTPETNPESSINYELGTRYNKKGIQLQAVGFYNDYQNLLGSDLAASGGLGTGDLFNGGAARTLGLEFFATYDLLNLGKGGAKFSLPFNLSYTYTDAVFLNDFDSDLWGTVDRMDQLPYITPHQFSAMLSLEHEKFMLSVSGRYTGSMRTVPGEGEINSEEKIESYFILDASAAYNVNRVFTIFANTTNLTNKVYSVARRPAGLRPGMPLSFMMGVKTNF
jgi:Fe(3+) dicitrate transport protein